jgi:ATP-dependent DNA helicase DinG
MLKPFREPIGPLAFVYAYSGRWEDNGNRIYSVAASIIDRENPGKDFNSHIHYTKSSERERYYSGITKDILQKAPLKDKVIESLRGFLKDQQFIFYLNNHDNINDLLEFTGDIRFIDLSFVAEFFLPHRESHTPKSLSEHIFQKQRDRISFSAPEMVSLSIELVKHICRVQLNDREHSRAAAIRFFLKKSNTLFGEAFCHIASHYTEYFGELITPCFSPDTDQWEAFLEQSAKYVSSSSSKDLSQPFKKTPEDFCGDIYRELGKTVKGFTYRPSQAEYSRNITKALNTGTILTIEAGTGTGKTLGYLLPVMEFLHRNPHLRIAVSTYTKNLQRQVFLGELELVKSINMLYRDIPLALLKGKSNYICTEKLAHLYDEDLRGKELLAWLYMLILVYNFREVDGDTLGDEVKHYLEEGFSFRQMHRETSSKIGCDVRHTRCPAQIVTSEAALSRLIITNHFKLALLERDSQLSGLFTNFIIDEANHFEHAIRESFAIEVSSLDVHNMLSHIEFVLNKHIRHASGDYKNTVRKTISAITGAYREIMNISSLLKLIHPLIETGETAELKCQHDSYKDGNISNNVEALREQTDEVIKGLEFLESKEVYTTLRIHPRTAQRLQTTKEMLVDAVESMKLFLGAMDLKNSVIAFQIYMRHWSLYAQAVDVAELIRQHVLQRRDSIVFTSATICHKESFDEFKKITGLDVFNAQSEDINLQRTPDFASIPSFFPKDNMEMIIPPDAISGVFDNKRIWIEKTAEMVLELIKSNKGRTLVLFSSYSDLESVVERIADDIMDAGYPLLVQRNGYQTGNISDEFRAIKESVLFGVDTFWYGVDYKGDTLTQVIITRIPFPHTSSPLQCARKITMLPVEYRRRYLYETYIKLMQGIGRLIRCETDRGKVVILDSRYNSLWFQNAGIVHTIRSEK